jgi:hypothetical protein
MRYHPSDSTPKRFYAWLVIGLAGALILVLLPLESWFGAVLLASASFVVVPAGTSAVPLSRAQAVVSILVAVLFAAFLLLAAVVLPPSIDSPSHPAGVPPLWFRLLIASSWSVFAALESWRFYRAHPPSAA